MKKLLLPLILIIVILLGNVTISNAQTSDNETVLSFQKKGDKIYEFNSHKQKYIDFTISGLETQQQVDEFIQIFLKIKQIMDFTISSKIIDNQRTASITFDRDIKSNFFLDALIECGVKNIFIDNEKFSVEKLKTEKQNKSKTAGTKK